MNPPFLPKNLIDARIFTFPTAEIPENPQTVRIRTDNHRVKVTVAKHLGNVGSTIASTTLIVRPLQIQGESPYHLPYLALDALDPQSPTSEADVTAKLAEVNRSVQTQAAKK